MAGGSEMSAPPSAAEALSSLLWQPYDCRSPPLPRSRTDGALASVCLAGVAAQSPSGGRHARASYRAIPPRHEMRLPVPAPAPLRKSDSVSVRVPGEPSRSECNVNIVQVRDAPEQDSVVPEREPALSVATAECQTEEPRRRRARRARAPRVPEALESVPPPPYSTLPPIHQVPVPVPVPVPVAVPPPPAPIVAPHPPAHRFPFQPIPLRLVYNITVFLQLRQIFL